MRIVSFFSTLIFFLLFLITCKSNPAPTPAVNVPSTTNTTPPITSPADTNTNTNNPGTSSGNTIGSSTGNSSGNTSGNSSGNTSGNSSGAFSGRHSSGIILDGASSYTVLRGDTLNGIARKFYQDGSLYPLIMMVSDAVSDVDKIVPQMSLIIPVLATNMNDPTARQSINRYFPQIANIEDQRGRHETAALIRNHVR